MTIETEAGSPPVEETKAPETALAEEVATTELPAENADQDAGTEAIDAKPGDSSDSDTQDAKPLTLLDVVQSAISDGNKEKDGSSAVKDDGEVGAEEAEAKPEGKAEEEKAKSDDEEDDVPFHNHPRWKKLLEERNNLTEPAAQYEQIQGFMQANDLSGEEVAEGYEIMALLKRNDPDSIQKALEWFEPRVDFLREQAGVTIPADIQDKLDSGLIDEDVAEELSRNRAFQARQGEVQARRTEQDTARETATTEQNARNGMATAVQSWENGIKASDPDYAKKAEMVQQAARSMVQEEGAPTTGAEAVELSKRAYARVNDQIKSFAPKPRRVAPAPASLSVTATATPKTLREAIERAL
jgi:hypothetical protein